MPDGKLFGIVFWNTDDADLTDFRGSKSFSVQSVLSGFNSY
jgi:hypothetical protein